ncbi:MAG TPA: GIY-YIG nuclease family protein [Rhizomicrobium sp.]|nr:GIY-YIG nuclease family protein [Rhizomicrobium sp.]
MREHIYFVYMLASKEQGTLYTGVTNDVLRRVQEHREGLASGFTKRYGVKRLVWFECHEDIRDAIVREKRIKRWRPDWKCALIEENNPYWIDLYPGLVQRLGRPVIDPALLAAHCHPGREAKPSEPGPMGELSG